MQAILRNEFHSREVAVAVMGPLPYTLTQAQAAKVRRKLCGHKDCACGVVRGRVTDTLGRPLGIHVDGDADGRATWTVTSA